MNILEEDIPLFVEERGNQPDLVHTHPLCFDEDFWNCMLLGKMSKINQ
jgi:hypothetical protein